MTNVPGGSNYWGPNGEILKYSVSDGRLLRWNSTWAMKYDDDRSVYSPYSFISGHARLIGTTHDASGGYDLNVTVPEDLTGGVVAAFPGDKIIGASLGDTQTRIWGLSLERGREGTLLFDRTWNSPWSTGNQTMSWSASSPEVGTLWSRELRQNYGVSFETGDLLWGPTHSQDYRDQFYPTGTLIAYGHLYTAGVGGTLYAYNLTTGETS